MPHIDWQLGFQICTHLQRFWQQNVFSITLHPSFCLSVCVRLICEDFITENLTIGASKLLFQMSRNSWTPSYATNPYSWFRWAIGGVRLRQKLLTSDAFCEVQNFKIDLGPTPVGERTYSTLPGSHDWPEVLTAPSTKNPNPSLDYPRFKARPFEPCCLKSYPTCC